MPLLRLWGLGVVGFVVFMVHSAEAGRRSKAAEAGRRSKATYSHGYATDTNLALHKTVEWGHGGSGFGEVFHDRNRVVDGFRTSHEMAPMDDPKLHVKLGSAYFVHTVRVTANIRFAGRIALFTIKAGNHVCGANLSVTELMTLDILCDPPQRTDTVTFEVPGKSRILEIAELQVYGTPQMPKKSSGPCYSGEGERLAKALNVESDGMSLESQNDYTSAACATCSGPGPSQCSTRKGVNAACGSQHAFVPVRNNGTEGYCMRYSHSMSFAEFPNVVLPPKLWLPTHSSRWGISKSMVAASTIVNNATIGGVAAMVVSCYTTKSVWCEPPTSKGMVKCYSVKSARLEKINRLDFGGADRLRGQGKHKCQKCSKCKVKNPYPTGSNPFIDDPKDSSFPEYVCWDIPGSETRIFVAAEKNSLCTAALKLL